MAHYLPYLLLITVWIYAFVDCLGTPKRQVRGLPKVVWLLIIVFFGEILVGPLAWLLAGKRRIATEYPRSAYGLGGRGADAADESGAAGLGERAEPAPWIAPDDNPEFLKSLSEQIRRKREDGTLPSEGE
ncbi:PLD nuclease N-terminal domain-containing protein [Streptomyces sp. NBC_01190]|uniref:PLD nuclease N-terminal domain-containing protein n=1 Tax=Streptomyces sp. NBC_01190 TaxID=2903767 RepID=UPI00386EB854|nr:PLD nuclease N-terminal domain-containing protein [Streptomyces sp. NBC_01190]